ncbi:hypothetical protein [Desulfovibrio sp.]
MPEPTEAPETQSPAPQAPDDGQAPDRSQRLAAYVDKLDQLKERSSLREVMERELLLEFIRANRANINEYPLLETQQNSVINLICQRGGEHPAYEYVRKLTGNFIVLLTHYGKSKDGPDQVRAGELRVQLENTETLLIKCLQGVVYALGLITDNFEEIVLRHFGAGGLDRYNALIQQMELDQNFWRAFIERFVAQQVKAAFEDIRSGDRYSLTREGQQLFIRYAFDDVLARLNPLAQAVEKTRIQSAIERLVTDPEEQKTFKVVLSCLNKGLAFIPENVLSRADVEFVARIACIDEAMRELRDRYLEHLWASREGTPEGESPERPDPKALQFLVEQAVASGVGAVIAVGVTRDSFAQALNAFFPAAQESIKALVGAFDFDSLERVLFYLLENQFLHLLRDLAAPEGGKLSIRSLRLRRTPQAGVDALFASGLTKIRKAKLWGPDRGRPDMLLFRQRTGRELAAAMGLLQMEEPLKLAILSLWEGASVKVEAVVLVDLEMVARTTTNMKAKLAEILGRFGIRPGRKEEGELSGEGQGA